MGNDSPKDAQSKILRQQKRIRSKSGKYLKPGALAQIRYAKASATAAKCTDLGKKRVTVVDTPKVDRNIMQPNTSIQQGSPLMLSPSRSLLPSPFAGTDDITPKTHAPQDSDSRLEALPFDLQVKIICLLHHDQLREVFHVSQKIRKAVLFARQYHFNYTTPYKTRPEMLTMILRNEKDGNGRVSTPSPQTPNAPRHGPRPPNRLKIAEIRRMSSILFQGSVFPSRRIVPTVMPKKPLCKPLASNRVLVYEDELCKAVAQNNLL